MSVIKTIIHATDFSAPSDHGLGLAGRLARGHGANMVLLHVVEPPSGQERVGKEKAKLAHDMLGERIAALRTHDPDLLVHGRVVEGLAVDSILKVSAELQSDLIVLGSHGRTGLSRVLMGSVADRVARQAGCPVLILKVPTRWPAAGLTAESLARFSTIIVPTDFSERSRSAISIAGALADEGTRLIILHVAGPVHIASEGYTEALEARLREFTITEPVVQPEYMLREGDPAEEILRLARHCEHPLVVMSSHGRSGLDRLFVGSVAEQILSGLPCPVLILRKKAGL